MLTGKTGPFEMVMGLEIHAQVNTQAKLFSGASTTFGAEPNSQVSYIDAGFPGMLPVLNAHAIEQAVRTGHALNAEINLNSIFARKNYFYPDLPCGYQISQYDKPIVGNGYLEIDLPDGSSKKIGIERLHLEMDAGKSMHDQHPSKSYIDLNRSGVPLMEIVSKPDLRTIDEVTAYIKTMRALLRAINTCDGNMEQGNLRCDVNVSVRRPGEPFGTRCEIKNLNSFKFIADAIAYEAQRQIEIIESGGKVVQETRLFDTTTGETRALRSKEDAQDYRYFPDPDLLPLTLDAAEVKRLKETLPELPQAKKARYMQTMGLSADEASTIVAEQEVADYFEVVAKNRDGKQAASWIIVELFGYLNKNNLSFVDAPISANHLAGLLDLIKDGTLSGKMAKDVFADMCASGESAKDIVAKKGLQQITDPSAIANVVDAVIAKNPQQVNDYRGGKDKLFGFFVGQVMKETGGKANPDAVNEILKQKLSA